MLARGNTVYRENVSSRKFILLYTTLKSKNEQYAY